MSLVVEHLSVSLGGTEVIRDISFEVPDGRSVGMIGESGSGKSVTALAVLGLLPEGAQVAGSVRWNGRQLLGLSERERARVRGAEIGMVFQDPRTALDPMRRVGRQMTEPLRLRRRIARGDRREVAATLASEVGLPTPEQIISRYPHQLSGGQRQRVGIAMALAAEPRLLVADEPTTALDVTVQAGILRLLADATANRGMSLLFITHDLAVLAQVASEVIVLEQGTIIERGAMTDLLQHPTHDVTRRLIADATAASWQSGDAS